MAWQGRGHRERLGKSGWQRQRENRKTLRATAGVCHICGRLGADVIDHIIPLAEGGTDTPANKAPAHSTPCHAAKTAQEARRGRMRAARLRVRPPDPHPGLLTRRKPKRKPRPGG